MKVVNSRLRCVFEERTIEVTELSFVAVDDREEMQSLHLMWNCESFPLNRFAERRDFLAMILCVLYYNYLMSIGPCRISNWFDFVARRTSGKLY